MPLTLLGAIHAPAWLAAAPAVLVGTTVILYWTCVGLMVLRVRRRARGVSRVLLPAERLEQLMWLIWVPLLAAWMILPWLSTLSDRARSTFWLAPLIDDSLGLVVALRLLAAFIGVWCLAQSIRCWLHMGKDWRMGVDPSAKPRLIDDGPFAYVRHPIYALSVLLMVCSATAVPTPAMTLLAVIHISLMHVKAHNEERFFHQQHGAAYAEYTRRVGRFVPRPRTLFSRRATETSSGRELRPLNSFQKAMLLWEETHPYIAAHAIQIAGPADLERLQLAVRTASAARGIGELEIDRERLELSYSESASWPIAILRGEADDSAALQQLLTAALNHPFPLAGHEPIRWSVIEPADRAAHWLVLAYHHIAADARSIVNLLADVMRQYRPADDAIVSSASPPIAARALLRQTDGRPTILGFLRAMLLYFQFRFVHKMPDERELGDDTHVLLHAMPPGFLDTLSAACRKHNVGLNDAFLAALTTAVARHTPDRHTSRHRRRLAIATVLSAARPSNRAATSALTVELSDAILMIRRPDAPLGELIREISAYTKRLKARRTRVRSVSAMQGFFIRNIWPIFDIPNHRRSYRKLLPICAGVSSFSGNELVESSPNVMRYIRACPCGPATPVVLAPTMLRDRLELGLTFRMSCLPEARARQLLADVVAALHAVCE